MKLYELSEEYRGNIAKLQDMDLPPEVVLDTIDEMQGDIKDKIRAVMIVSMELEKLAESRKDCAKKMLESARAVETRAEGLRSYAQIAIQNCGLQMPLQYPDFTINLQRNPTSCSIDDIEQLPTVFKTVEASFTVNAHEKVTGDDIASVLEEAGITVRGGVKIEVKADKKTVLDALKKVAEGERIPGAHINPTSYRVAVK